MKRIKKLASVLLALVMMFALSVTAFADNKPVSGETYTAYKIFDATISGEGENQIVSYTIDKSSEWLTDVQGYANTQSNGLTLTESADGTKYVVTYTEETFSAASFAATLAEKTSSKTASGTANSVQTGTTIITVNGGNGYYLITSSLGATAALVTDGSNTVTIVEKNTVPTIAKSADKANATIGQEITYTLTFTDGTGTNLEATITDTMPNALTYIADSLSWKIGNADATSSAGDVVTSATTTDGTITIKIDTSKLEKDATVVFTYKAYINDTASADTAITNNVELKYSEQTSMDDATVKTFDFDLEKTDGANQLSGAEFTLYTNANHNSPVTLIAVDGGYKVYDGKTTLSEGTTTTTTITAGKVNVAGLAAGTYYLTETKAPTGYNLLTSDVVITIGEDGSVSVNNETTTVVTVVNTAGSELPTTGGMGTTLLYTLGIVLVLGAGVLLVVRRRMSAE